MNGTISEVRLFAGSFAPQNWALCNGQSLSISENTPLFSLIGTTYGGDGVNYFNVPNLAGAAPIGAGQGPTLSDFQLGQTGGAPEIYLNNNNIGVHTHPVTGSVQGTPASAEDGHFITPVGNFPAVNGDNIYSTTASEGTFMAPPAINLSVDSAGEADPQPLYNMSPYIVMNYIICVDGYFPSRN